MQINHWFSFSKKQCSYCVVIRGIRVNYPPSFRQFFENKFPQKTFFFKKKKNVFFFKKIKFLFIGERIIISPKKMKCPLNCPFVKYGFLVLPYRYNHYTDFPTILLEVGPTCKERKSKVTKNSSTSEFPYLTWVFLISQVIFSTVS